MPETQQPPIGIDLGTTYSAVATIDRNGRSEMLRNSDGDTITPSVVLFDSGDVLVGTQAKMQRAAFPEDVVEFVKRQMGNPSWRFYNSQGEGFTAEAISALILKRVAADAALVLGTPVKSVVVTVPAYFDEAQRNATKQAGEIAGLEVLSVINEPTAAAVSFGVDTDFQGTVMVYDLGGGTFDVTILRAQGGAFNTVQTDGDRNLGGFDFDNLVIEWAKAEFAAQGGNVEFDAAFEAQLRERAEQAKHRLSSSDQAPFFVSRDGVNVKLVLTRGKFEELSDSLLARTEMLVENVLEDAGLTPAQIDKVLLVGGSTRMPMVPAMLQRAMGKAPDQSVHPDEAVARGAAIVADLRSAEAKGSAPLTSSSVAITISDVISHGLGMIALDEQRNTKYNAVIIPANTTIPEQRTERFFTLEENQTQLLVEVTEGDDKDIRYIKRLGDSMLTLPPHPIHSPVDVTYSCDIDGILHILVVDGLTGLPLGEFEIERVANLDRHEVDQMRTAISRMDVQ